ncbi:DUF2339 domain-containing protein [Bacillus testis]|uniref:DUF2339 domain-containing protein n=1 Tax=Bacillus testis TaxID=1622072 RepID=UPI00067EE72D|nr:DUF2339 domain-containing protein [Bacillus testis]
MDKHELDRHIQQVEATLVSLRHVLADLKKQKQYLDQETHYPVQAEEKTQVEVSPQSADVSGRQDNVREELKQIRLQKGQENRQTSADRTSVTVHDRQVKEPFDLLKMCQIWLPRLFAFIMLLGVVWLFKAGIDNGVMKPIYRILFGVLLSVGLWLTGEKQVKKERQTLGLVLIGASIASIVVTTFAAHYLFHYFPAVIALVLNIIWFSAGILLAVKHRSEYLSIFVGVGAFFVPFLLNSDQPNSTVFLVYEAILTLGLFQLAASKSYKLLYMVAYFTGLIVLGIYSFFTGFPSLSGPLSIMYTVYQVGLYLHLKVYRGYIIEQRISLFSINGGLLLLSLQDLPHYSASLLTVAAVIYFAIMWKELKNKEIPLLSTVLFGLGMLSVMVVIGKKAEGDMQPLLYLVQGLVSLAGAYVWKDKIKAVIGGMIYVLGILLVLAVSVEQLVSVEALSHIAVLVSFVLIFWKAGRFIFDYAKTAYQLLVYGCILLSFILITKLAGAATINSDINSLAVSVSWMVLALSVIWYGRSDHAAVTFKKNELVILGLAVVCLTIVKLFFMDLPFVSMTIRALLFLVVGAIGVGISRLFFSNSNQEEAKKDNSFKGK